MSNSILILILLILILLVICVLNKLQRLDQRLHMDDYGREGRALAGAAPLARRGRADCAVRAAVVVVLRPDGDEIASDRHGGAEAVIRRGVPRGDLADLGPREAVVGRAEDVHRALPGVAGAGGAGGEENAARAPGDEANGGDTATTNHPDPLEEPAAGPSGVFQRTIAWMTPSISSR